MRGASDRDYCMEIADDLRQHGMQVRITRFFGGAGLAMDGRQFGFVIKGSLYFRVDACTRRAYEAQGSSPFEYQARGKTVSVATYFEVPIEVLDSAEELTRWAKDAFASTAEAKRLRSKMDKRSRSQPR